jgi:hypothetical protein
VVGVLSRRAAVAVLAAAAVLPASGAGAAERPSGSARMAAPAAPQAAKTFGVLKSVYCTSVSSCWAVGYRGTVGNAEVNQALHWNGRTWGRVKVPTVGGTGFAAASGLDAVRCTTAKDCWAVGYVRHGNLVSNQALHWNGKRWARIPTPDPGGAKQGETSELFDVTCAATANCWAVGDFGATPNSNVKLLNQVLHWNGKRWSQVHVVNPGGTTAGHVSSLHAVRCGSARNCNAVGEVKLLATAVTTNEVLHWNGIRWSRAAVPQPAGTGIGDENSAVALACAAAQNCWAAGAVGLTTAPGKVRNQTLHWNGRRWTKATTANPNVNTPGVDDELAGATCASTRDCWAVGKQAIAGSGGAVTNEALHWNGTRWSLVPTPDPGGSSAGDFNTLYSVRCPAQAGCWAVGYASNGGPLQDEILFWNGGKWSVD